MALQVLLLALQPEQVLSFAEFAKHSSGRFSQFPESGGPPLQLLADISPYSSSRFEWHFSSVPMQYNYWLQKDKPPERQLSWLCLDKRWLHVDHRLQTDQNQTRS